ncbi:MAG: hypothetical protein R2749_12495 [Acidimicrobiales bacterium]
MAGATSFLTADIVYYVLEAVSETTPFPRPPTCSIWACTRW